MTDLRKAAEMALDVLRNTAGHSNQSQTRIDDAKHALVQALAQPEQEAIKQAYLDGVNSGIKAEREACAMVCESMPTPKHATTLTHAPTLETCAAAIRARGNHD